LRNGVFQSDLMLNIGPIVMKFLRHWLYQFGYYRARGTRC
jgi:hypothetical protein